MSYKELFRKVVETVKRLFWVLAPGGGFVNPFKVLLEYSVRSKYELQTLISEYYPHRELFFLNSAKSSLYLLFNNLRIVSGKDLLALSAYTCPDIASSAIKAKLKLHLLDLDENSLNIKVPEIEDSGKFCAVIGTNLYGLDDSKNLRGYSSKTEITFIDDQCQSVVNQDHLIIAVTSFGRGKALCAAGGGLLCIPSDKKYESIVSEINYSLREIPHAHVIEDIFYSIKLLIYWLFERPYLYWILANLPFTKLGETRVDLDFQVRKASKMELAAMLVALKTRDNNIGRKKEIIKKYASEISVSLLKRYSEQNILLRYPVLISERMRSSMTEKSTSFLKKYGISLSYPRTLDEYPELTSEIINRGLRNARIVSRGILTLPIHKYVRNSDIGKIINFLNQFKG